MEKEKSMKPLVDALKLFWKRDAQIKKITDNKALTEKQWDEQIVSLINSWE